MSIASSEAFEAAYRKHRRILLWVAKQFGDASHAEDVVHTAFLDALEQAASGALDTSRPLRPMLRAMTKTRARDFWRWRFRDIADRDDVPEKPRGRVDAEEAGALTRLTAERLWAELTPGERLAVTNLHILEEQMSRADEGVFAARIRLARRRFKGGM